MRLGCAGFVLPFASPPSYYGLSLSLPLRCLAGAGPSPKVWQLPVFLMVKRSKLRYRFAKSELNLSFVLLIK
jgi:hypothetical protein